MFHANILDPAHNELSPLVWDQPETPQPILKPQHARWIKRVIYAALTSAGYTDVEHWLKLVLTGSLTTYQYSNESDVDVSLFVDTKVFPEWSRAEMIGVMIDKVDGNKLPGTPFPMQDFVVSKDIKPEDLYKPGLRSGYDIDTNKWIVPPEKGRIHNVEAEENGFYVYSLQMADKMDRLLRYEPDKAVQFWHQIHAKRSRDQRAGKGDFAESNIIYKFLSQRGLMPRIEEASGEHIAKGTLKKGAPYGKQMAKFVYDPMDNRVVIGEMGAHEGEKATHAELAKGAGWGDLHNLTFGHITENGLGQTYGRPRIPGGMHEKGLNQYMTQYRTEEALRRAVPGAYFPNAQERLNEAWELPKDPEVIYHGEPPVINPQEVAGHPQPQKEPWSFI